MHIIWKYMTDSSLKMAYVGIFVKQTLCFFVLKPEIFCKPGQREDNSYNLPMSRMSLAMSWRSVSFQLKTEAKK